MKYLEDSYLKEIETIVTNINGKEIELQENLFYPQSGGQETDKGKIKTNTEEYDLIFVKKDKDKIIHELNKEGLKKGDKVRCILNWERRYKLMRSHTAAHLLYGIFSKKFGQNLKVTGNNISPEKVRMDFSLKEYTKEKIEECISEVNEAINENIPTEEYYISQKDLEKNKNLIKLARGISHNLESVRILKIGNIDEQPDGGTHVKNTSEIRGIELMKIENRGKENRRVYFKLRD